MSIRDSRETQLMLVDARRRVVGAVRPYIERVVNSSLQPKFANNYVKSIKYPPTHRAPQHTAHVTTPPCSAPSSDGSAILILLLTYFSVAILNQSSEISVLIGNPSFSR